MASRSKLPGETADQCRLRVMAECQQEWRANAQLRSEYKTKAMEVNRSSSLQVAMQQDQNEDNAVAMNHQGENQSLKDLYPLVLCNQNGVGPMGIGDDKFGLSTKVLTEQSENTGGFVKNFSNDWNRRAGGTIVSNETFNSPMKLSCFEEFGFCWREVTNREVYFRVENHLLLFIQNFRQKFMHNKTNLGPDAKIKQPLLIASKGTLDM